MNSLIAEPVFLSKLSYFTFLCKYLMNLQDLSHLLTMHRIQQPAPHPAVGFSCLAGISVHAGRESELPSEPLEQIGSFYLLDFLPAHR